MFKNLTFENPNFHLSNPFLHLYFLISFENMRKRIVLHYPSILMGYNMSSYFNPELRYSCYSEPILVSRSHLPLTGRGLQN